MFDARKNEKQKHNPATALLLRAPKPKPRAVRRPKSLQARKLLDFYSMLVAVAVGAACVPQAAADCASLYALQNGAWAATTDTALAHNCSLCISGVAPPLCACSAGTFLHTNGTACMTCPLHSLCAGIFAPPVSCGTHRVTLTAGGACVCADGFAPSGDSCVPCPSTAWCRDGVKHTCPAHSIATLANTSSCTCAPGAARGLRWVPFAGNISHLERVDAGPLDDANTSDALPSNTSTAVYIVREGLAPETWVPDAHFLACRLCTAGTFCVGGSAGPELCAPGRTSVPGASARAACHCLPPLTPQAGACVDPAVVAATLELEAHDIAALAPGAILVAEALGCAAAPHGLRATCPAVTRVLVQNASHIALFLENMVVRPAYLGLLYAFLEDARVVSESYAMYQESWAAGLGRGRAGHRCTAVVSTASPPGADPAATHYASVGAAWDAAARTHIDSLLHTRQHTDAVAVELEFSTTLPSLDALPVHECVGSTAGTPQRLAGTRVRVPRLTCPTLAELQCLTHGAPLAASAEVVCESELWWISSHTSVPNFTCVDGSVVVHSAFVPSADAAIAVLEALPTAPAFRSGPFVAGRIDLAISPHVHSLGDALAEESFVLSSNRSRWVMQAPPDRARQHLAGIFAGLGLAEPLLAEVGADVGLSAVAHAGQGLDITVRGALLPLRAVVALVHAVAARTGVAYPPVGTHWRETAGVALGWRERRVFALTDSSNATLADVFVNETHSSSLRPLGEVRTARAVVSGIVDLAGPLPRVAAAILALDPAGRPMLRMVGAGNASTCTSQEFSVHTRLTASIDPTLVNQFAVGMLRRFLLDPSRHAATSSTLTDAVGFSVFLCFVCFSVFLCVFSVFFLCLVSVRVFAAFSGHAKSLHVLTLCQTSTAGCFGIRDTSGRRWGMLARRRTQRRVFRRRYRRGAGVVCR